MTRVAVDTVWRELEAEVTGKADLAGRTPCSTGTIAYYGSIQKLVPQISAGTASMSNGQLTGLCSVNPVPEDYGCSYHPENNIHGGILE